VPLLFVYDLTLLRGTLEACDEIRESGSSSWRLTLRQRSQEHRFTFDDVAYGNLSADQIAELRARRLLLNEAPRSAGVPTGAAPDSFLEALVQGVSTPLKIIGSPLPELWQSTKENPAEFATLARLVCVFELALSGTVEAVLRLDIAVRGNDAHVIFRGQRRQQYVNQEPAIITVEGTCHLAATP